MSLQSVQFDPFLLAQLYRAPLVPRQGEAEPVTGLRVLGHNGKGVLFVIHNEKEAFLEDTLFTFFTKILGACGMSMADVALVNLAGDEPDFLTLKSRLAPEKVVLLGTSLTGVSSAGHPKNRVWEDQHCRFIHTDALPQLRDNLQLKTEFWAALKQLFNLS